MKIYQNMDRFLKEKFKCRTLNVGIQSQTHRGIPRPSRNPISQVMESTSSDLGSHESHPHMNLLA